MTDKDREIMRGKLGEYRLSNNGLGVANMHHLMIQLGYPEMVVNQDKELMREYLGELRENMRGGNLTWIQHDLKQIFQREEAMGHEMLPLKKLT